MNDAERVEDRPPRPRVGRVGADLLRRAADKIRETANAADDGPWYPADGNALHWHGPDPDLFIDSAATLIAYGPIKETNAEHIALWSPDVAELVARMLSRAEELYRSEVRGYLATGHSDEVAHQVAALAVKADLDLARRILGEDHPDYDVARRP